MIAALLTGFFNLVLQILATILQVILLPVNALFVSLFPDLPSQLNIVTNGILKLFSNFGWILNLIPPLVKNVLVIIFTIEVALFVVMKSTRLTAKLWKLLQKIKFW